MKNTFTKPSMLCAVIKGPSFDEASEQIRQSIPQSDLLEFRLDHFHEIGREAIQRLKFLSSLPVIFTLRDQTEGGYYQGTEEERFKDIECLMQCEPEFLDLEHHIPSEIIERMINKHPKTKIILSYHNFLDVPSNLDEIYQSMKKKPAWFYKICLASTNSLDTLKVMEWKLNQSNHLITICMGTHGEQSRILAPTVGCPISYTCVNNASMTAAGQIDTDTLLKRYNYSSFNADTALFGLIGDPVEHSISHITHNHLFTTLGLNAVYTKMKVAPDQLKETLQLLKKLSFKGISVTMPLKEAVIPFLDDIDPQAQEIGAVNTLEFRSGKIIGHNTDGKGALNAIETISKVEGKKVLVLGAGGAAKGIIHEALHRKAHVTILNRTVEKARQLAKQWNCLAGSFDDIEKHPYEVIINTAPHTVLIDTAFIIPKSIVMDINIKSNESPFLKAAEKKECRVIHGVEMFIEQAIGQFSIWFKEKIEPRKTREILSSKAIFNAQL